MEFSSDFKNRLRELFIWRRDVRHFSSQPIEQSKIDYILRMGCLAPSVGFSQPWRFVNIKSYDKKQKAIENYIIENDKASKLYQDEKAKKYASLKLSGMKEAPCHIAVFCDTSTNTGSGLGIQTMPEMLSYSVVAAVQNMWLAARAEGIGIGWVSIIDPNEIKKILDIDNPDWKLVAYLCIGKPIEEIPSPELLREGWEKTIHFSHLYYEK